MRAPGPHVREADGVQARAKEKREAAERSQAKGSEKLRIQARSHPGRLRLLRAASCALASCCGTLSAWCLHSQQSTRPCTIAQHAAAPDGACLRTPVSCPHKAACAAAAARASTSRRWRVQMGKEMAAAQRAEQEAALKRAAEVRRLEKEEADRARAKIQAKLDEDRCAPAGWAPLHMFHWHALLQGGRAVSVEGAG